MNNLLIYTGIKIVSIIIIIIIFGLLVNNYLYDFINNNDTLEPFGNFDNKKEDENKEIIEMKPYNTRILYNNVGELPWNRHTISSSIPFDVTVKKEVSNAFYYEFNNADYELNLKKIFKNKCEELIIATDGNKWSKWIDPKSLNSDKDKLEIQKIIEYYNKIFDIVKEKLNNTDIMDLQGDVNNPKKIQIVHDIMKRYRYNLDNKSYYIFDIEMILYRVGKLQGKHIKIIATTNGITVNIIVIKIIGVISEDNIVLYPYTGTDILNKNNMDFDVFTPSELSYKKSDETEYDTILSGLDKNIDSSVTQIMYDKLLKDYNEEDADLSNKVL